MPGHTNTSDPHEHGRPARPKSGSARKGTTTTSVFTKPKTNTNTSGSGTLVKRGVKRNSQTTDQKQTKTTVNEQQDNILEDQNQTDKVGNGKSTSEMDESDVKEKVIQESSEDDANDEKHEDEVQNLGNTRTRFTRPGTPPKPETPPPTPPSPQKPEVFTLEKFNDTVDTFSGVFSSQKFTHVTDNYPVDELQLVVSDVSGKIEEFKQQTVTSQRHLEDLRERMHEVKDRIQQNIQQKSNAIRMHDETQSIEEKELREKLARLNAQVAQANAELAEALRLSAETEHTAVEAQLAAERAKEEARNIQEEIAFREKVEERRREQEKQKQEEERRKMEEQRRLEEEARREKEAEWKRREHGPEKAPEWETWPSYEYKVSDGETGCVIRGHPNKFKQNDVMCTTLDQLECPVPFSENEELVSSILSIEHTESQETLPDKIVVCIPFRPTKQAPGHNSKEVVIKVEKDGHWTCLETREESIDSYKETKFAAAEIRTLGRMAVFSRLKRDYATVSKRGGKVTSSYDPRISLTIPRDGISGKDHILMEVQPVDSSSLNDLKNRSKTCKGLLNSSPIVHMEFETSEFKKPVTVTVPCPPNPIKAKKIAAMRKAKEEKMKNPPKVQVLLPHEIEAMEKEKQKSKLQKMQEQLAAEENKVEEPKPTKWYMGDYANNEDDENDNLFLISAQGNKWTPVENVNIMQVKLDLLQFDLDKPLEKFMVLRTKTNVHEDTIGHMASEMSEFLSQKFVQVILKQKSEDPFDTVMSVVPQSKTDKTLKKLSQEGYDDGPEPSQVLSINEGDIIEVGFRGNIKNKDEEGIQFVYNSNLKSETEFYACEVDKYLQKNFPVYRGVVEVYRKYKVKTTTKRKRRDSVDDNKDEQPFEYKRDKMCELAINIPKYHVEQNSTVVRAPVTIHNTSDVVNEQLMRFVAEELGDEWKVVASHLNVSKPRVQAIIRNMQYGDQSDADARFDMLMTWLKKTPKAVDKVMCLSSALLKSGRGDLAEEIKARDREFREHQRSH